MLPDVLCRFAGECVAAFAGAAPEARDAAAAWRLLLGVDFGVYRSVSPLTEADVQAVAPTVPASGPNPPHSQSPAPPLDPSTALK